ncbi:hypothetical protein [Pandoraea sp. ISTKB]|uniref:hypothetical protein n=1 Tax=Pandoraea sp. ISTKB TaxID=1586708 RepID=UPI0008464FFC|nr:hypothetical protein [Pandoraea sp. ISTKB]ODP34596.1 hypothetical protein A9762_14470 [Pandoraea sp. ISTKB]
MDGIGRALNLRLSARPTAPLLRARIAFARLGVARAAVLACLLCALMALAAFGLALTRDDTSSVVAAVSGKRRPSGPSQASAPVDAGLLAFFETLGNRRQNDLHIKLFFDLAKQNGLTLKQGEYQYGYDNAAHVATCQVVLPLKGNYDAIWHFVLEVLKTLPFAALQDINFKRDAIGDAAVSAQVRFTLYLRDGPVRTP